KRTVDPSPFQLLNFALDLLLVDPLPLPQEAVVIGAFFEDERGATVDACTKFHDPAPSGGTPVGNHGVIYIAWLATKLECRAPRQFLVNSNIAVVAVASTIVVVARREMSNRQSHYAQLNESRIVRPHRHCACSADETGEAGAQVVVKAGLEILLPSLVL